MKYIYSLVFLSVANPHIMSMSLTEKQIAACNKIKNINPLEQYVNPTSEYKQTALLLHQNNVSTCTCMRYFIEEKTKRAHKALEKEFEITPHWQEHDRTIAAMRAEDVRNAQLIFHPSLPQHEGELIQNMIQEKNIQLPLYVKKSNSNRSCYIGLRRLIPQNTRIFKLALTHRDFDNCNEQEKIGTLLHELKHAEQSHLYYEIALAQELQKKAEFYKKNRVQAYDDCQQGNIIRKILNIKDKNAEQIYIQTAQRESWYEQKVKNLKRSPSYLKFSRSQEAEADRIPAACGTCEDARAITSMTIDIFKTTPARNAHKQSTHPSPVTRIEWAMRIKGVKEAEEALRINEPERKINMYFSRTTNQFE
ncbi:MAG: M48 family metalloprotease [Candidatus Babeliaceae bacterium]|jgi:hypothetical protein